MYELKHTVIQSLVIDNRSAGFDAVKGDGIYSRAFCDLPVAGRYSVRVKIQNWQLKAVAGLDLKSLSRSHPEGWFS